MTKKIPPSLLIGALGVVGVGAYVIASSGEAKAATKPAPAPGPGPVGPSPAPIPVSPDDPEWLGLFECYEAIMSNPNAADTNEIIDCANALIDEGFIEGEELMLIVEARRAREVDTTCSDYVSRADYVVAKMYNDPCWADENIGEVAEVADVLESCGSTSLANEIRDVADDAMGACSGDW